jgi:hypothetical protein
MNQFNFCQFKRLKLEARPQALNELNVMIEEHTFLTGEVEEKIMNGIYETRYMDASKGNIQSIFRKCYLLTEEMEFQLILKILNGMEPEITC